MGNRGIVGENYRIIKSALLMKKSKLNYLLKE